MEPSNRDMLGPEVSRRASIPACEHCRANIEARHIDQREAQKAYYLIGCQIRAYIEAINWIGQTKPDNVWQCLALMVNRWLVRLRYRILP